jgi:O-antigen/teichoic acid export membrane protein
MKTLFKQSVKSSDMRKNPMASFFWISNLLSSNRLAKNVSANLIGGGWNGLLIVFATPWYVSLLSMEGYGLLGFWLLMQMVLSLCDLGLGATLIREFADSTGQHDRDDRRRDLLRTLEYVYWPVAAFITVVMLFASDWIASNWLRLHVLSINQVAIAIKLMALSLGLQFPCALYSSGLAGLQSQGRMNFLQMVGNSLRYGGGVAILFWRADPVCFFCVQAFVAGVQTLATRAVLWRMIRGVGNSQSVVFRLEFLQRLWRFSAGMALTMIAGVLLTNVDRLFLSKLASAEELGKYTLAFTATGLLQMGIQPFYRAYFPRFAELFAMGDNAKLRKEYYQGCRLVAGIIIPFALIGGVFAPEIFMAWVGRADKTIVDVFRWLLLGIASAGLMWLPAAYQQAHGWTRLHVAMITGALCLGGPSLFWTIKHWGTAGATAVWVLHGVSDVTLGLWLMHKRLLPGEFFLWYRIVALPPLSCSLPIVGLSWWLIPSGLNSWSNAAWLGITSLLVIMSTLLFVNFKSLDI